MHPPGTTKEDIERIRRIRIPDVTCAVCGRRYFSEESPMLKNEIWEEISNEHFDKDGNWVSQHICAECMERKLGRRITEDDLMLDLDGIHVPWNDDYIEKNLPSHRIQLFKEKHAKAIEELKKAWGIAE